MHVSVPTNREDDMAFLDDDYLLTNDTASRLYERVRDLPIIDAHNHADVAALAADRPFPDIWEAEAATDHYVWEMLRKRGVAEKYITGDAPNEEKWLAMADVFDELAGNPTFEWVHLDLRRQLGIDDLVCAANARKIWETAGAVFARDDMRPQALLKRMQVERMCTTDDPVDTLEHHRALENSSIAGMVRPTFRPDKAMNIFKPGWRAYIGQLEEVVNTSFQHISDLIAALRDRHDFFAQNGCVASDHGVETPFGFNVEEKDADAIFRKAYAGKELDRNETVAYMSYLLQQVAEMDTEKDWVFQLHIGAVRDVRDSLYRDLGPDSGGDVSDHATDILTPLRDFLNRFDDRLKIVFYTLSPVHESTVATLCRAFGSKVNMGSAWWLNDSPIGMKRQLEYMGTVDVLMNFAGMVSDSRKLLSYGSRNEMFRRVLCDVLGNMTEAGQIPVTLAERTAEYLSYRRAKELFNL